MSFRRFHMGLIESALLLICFNQRSDMFYFILGAVLFGIYALFSNGILDLNAAMFLFFISVVGALIYKDRKKIKIISGILLMRRTKRFRDTIDEIANSYKRFWGVFGTIGVVVAILTMIFGTLLLVDQSVKIATGVTKEG